MFTKKVKNLNPFPPRFTTIWFFGMSPPFPHSLKHSDRPYLSCAENDTPPPLPETSSVLWFYDGDAEAFHNSRLG